NKYYGQLAIAMATFEKSSTTSSLLSSPSSFSCRSPALQQSLGTASPSLSPCPSLNASSVIVLLPDDSVRLYEQRISADRVLAEFPQHELRRAGSRRSLDANSRLSSRETYTLIDPQYLVQLKSPLHNPTLSPQPQKRPPPLPQSEPPVSQNELFSPTTPPFERARTTSPDRSQPAATTVCRTCTAHHHHVQSAGQLHGRITAGGSGKAAAFGATSSSDFVHAAEVSSRRRGGCRGAVAPQHVFEAIVAAPSSPEGPSPPSGRSADVDAARDRLRSASMSDARISQHVARHDLSAGAAAGACGRATVEGTSSPRECPGDDDQRFTDFRDKFATSPESEAEGDDTPAGVTLDQDSCCFRTNAAWTAQQHSMASPLLRQSSLTTYLPSTAAAIAGSGGFQAEAASTMRHGAHAAASLSRFHGPKMAGFFDSLGSRSVSAAGAPDDCVRPAPPLLEVPAEFLLDTSAGLTGTSDSELLRHGEVRFDAWMDHPAAADVPTPRLPRRRQGYPAAEGGRGTAAMAAQTERRGGDASGNGATTSGSSGGVLAPNPPVTSSLAPTDRSVAVCNCKTQDAVGLVTASEKEPRCASGGGEEDGSSERGAAAAAASGARPGFVRQRATSACLDLSSSTISGGSGDGGGEDFRETSRGGRAGRAGSSLFEEWTDLGGRPPWVTGDSGNTPPGKDASAKATETRRPIFHQKTPSGRILQELFDLENGPLDLEFLVSLRTPSRRHYDSPAHSSARSSPYARRTPATTPPRPPSSLAPSPPAPTAPTAPTAAAASDGPALSYSASASAALGSEATESSISSAASSESLSAQEPALDSANPLAPAADDCSVDEEDEAAAAAASAWAAVELVDGSVSPAASVSRGWIASAARSRFISRIASSFNYSSLHGRRGLFGLRAKSGSSNSNSSSSITTGGNGNSMAATGTAATTSAAAAAAAAGSSSAPGSGKFGSRVGGSTRSLIRRGTMPVVRHEHMATALDGSFDHFAAAAASASGEASAAVHASASDGDVRHAFHLPGTAQPLPRSAAAVAAAAPGAVAGGQSGAGSRGCSRSMSVGATNSSSSGSNGSSTGMAHSSSTGGGDVAPATSMVAPGSPEPSLHDAAWRLLLLQQQKIAMMEEEIMQLRQRCRAAGLGSDKSRSGGGAVAASGSSEGDGFLLEGQGGEGASGGAPYCGLGQYSVINVRRGLREGAQATGESNSCLNLPLLETGSDATDCLGGNESLSVHILYPTSSHSTLSWRSHAARPDSLGDNLVSPRFSPRPAVAAMGAAAAAAAVAAGKALVSSPSAGGIRHGFRAF
ncbi:unnamed protein product, partial [Closterium sp. NIES-54]